MTPASAALRASSGPQKASASTVTLTTCLPWAKASRQWSTAAIGWPGHSTTTSMAGCRTSACQSVPTCVMPLLMAWSIDDACDPSARHLGEQVGDARQVHTGRVRDLREVHRAELAGADQADADGTAFGGALLEF